MEHQSVLVVVLGRTTKLTMSEVLQVNWQRVMDFGKVLHILITDNNQKKTACGHDVSNFTTKPSSMGKKCGLCFNVNKQWSTSSHRENRFTNSYEPSEILASGKYS